jgi:glutathione S-transferase
MLTLYTFGPYFGLPDGSPFCIKAQTLLAMSGLPHRVEKMNFRQAPKGKAPYLSDDGQLIADSHFIQRHLETRHGINFDAGYDAATLAKGWAFSRMAEEHLYFLNIDFRWLDDGNFEKGPANFFAGIPGIIRPMVKSLVRRQQRKRMNLQGLGRHTAAEKAELAIGDIAAVENTLSEGGYLLGPRPSGADASVFSFLWSLSAPIFESQAKDYLRSRPRIMSYIGTMQAQYFPDFPLR